MTCYFNFNLGLLAILLVAFVGCNKPDDQNNGNNGNEADSIPVKIDGTIYWASRNKILSLNLKTNEFIESPIIKFYSIEPVAYDSGLVYTSDRYGISCVNITTNAIVWERQYSSFAYGTSNVAFESSLLISGNLVFVTGQTGDNGQHSLYAIDKTSGIIKWQKPTTGINDFSKKTTLAVYGDQIFALGNDDLSTGSRLTKIFSFNKNTGAVVWEAKFNAIFGSNLSVKDGLLYAYIDNPASILAINVTDGSLKWKSAPFEGTSSQKILFAETELVLQTQNYDQFPYINYYHYFDYKTGLKKGTLVEQQTFFYSWTKTDHSYITSAENSLTAFDIRTHAKLWKVQKQHFIDKDTIPNVAALAETKLLCYNDYVIQYSSAMNMTMPLDDRRTLSIIYISDIKTGKIVQRIAVKKENPPGNFILVNQNRAYYTHMSGNSRE